MLHLLNNSSSCCFIASELSEWPKVWLKITKIELELKLIIGWNYCLTTICCVQKYFSWISIPSTCLLLISQNNLPHKLDGVSIVFSEINFDANHDLSTSWWNVRFIRSASCQVKGSLLSTGGQFIETFVLLHNFIMMNMAILHCGKWMITWKKTFISMLS